MEWLRALSESLRHADVPEARAELVHAIYEMVVAGRTIVGARLTPAAYAHRLAGARPEVVKASPAGDGDELTAWSIPIEGRHGDPGAPVYRTLNDGTIAAVGIYSGGVSVGLVCQAIFTDIWDAYHGSGDLTI